MLKISYFIIKSENIKEIKDKIIFDKFAFYFLKIYYMFQINKILFQLSTKKK